VARDVLRTFISMGNCALGVRNWPDKRSGGCIKFQKATPLN